MSGRDGWNFGAAEVRGMAALRDATRGTFDFWTLAGPSMARTRQAIASAMEGKPVPQSKCGVTRLREVFMDLFRTNHPERFNACQCTAQRDSAFADYARDTLAEHEARHA